MADQDKARWTKLVADFEVSDLSQREFATERGISLNNLRYWIYRLRKESRPLVDDRLRLLAEPLGRDPVKVLADTIGKLLVDGYSGYKRVTLPGGRQRAGCFAHLRRRFFEAQSAAPEAAKRAMDFILDVYKIERAALDSDLLGAPQQDAADGEPSRPGQTQGLARHRAGPAPAAGTDGRGHQLCARPVGRADALPH